MEWILDLFSASSLAPAEVLGFMLGLTAKVTVVLALAAVIALGLKNSSAAIRHLVWTLGLAGAVALPVLTGVGPGWDVPGLEALKVSAVASEPVRSTIPPASLVVREAQGFEAVTEAAGLEVTTAVVPVSRLEDPETQHVASPHGSTSTASSWLTANEDDWRLGILSIWALGTLVVTLLTVMGMIRVRLLARGAEELIAGPLRSLVDELAGEVGVARPVKLLQSPLSSMPMTFGFRSKVMVPVDADDWTDERLRAVLLHELSHVKRHDYLTQLLGRFACALHWFNPLVWIAARRMMIEREHACDDRVLSSGSRPSDYAAALLDIARSMRNGPLASVASVAMARRSQLSDRLLAVLDAGRKRANVTGKLVARAGVAAAFVVLPIAGAGIGASESPEESSDPQLTEVDSASTTRVSTPLETLASLSAATDVLASSGSTSGAISAIRVSQGECDWNARHNSTSTSVSSNDRETSVRIRVGNCRLRIELSGDITFNDDETDVTSISRGGYLEIEERDGRTRRKIEIERNGADLERRWVVDGDQQVFGADARAFLADMLPLLFRRVGLQAEERATRILEQQGVDGLLREISLIPSDHTARKYFGVALLKGKLDVSQVRKIVRLAGQEIASDFELAQLLVDVAESHPVDEAVKAAYVEAAGTIGSDFEHRRVLSAILARDALSTEVAAEMLAQATEINSDFELAELLVGIMGKHPIDKALTPAFFNAVKTIGSDFEQRRVLNKVLDVRPLTEEAVAAILESSLSISSDFELARVLIKIANRLEIGDALRPAFLEAADSISSEYERGRVMSALAPRGKVG